MRYSSDQATRILKMAEDIMTNEGEPSLKLFRMWMTIASVHGMMLSQVLRKKIGNRVYSGPFKGMELTPAVMDGNFAPKLLGYYEHELHSVVGRVVMQPYRQILNIGCSFGYYSVGLARAMPQAVVHAFDIDAESREQCRDMAALNRVGERVKISGEFRGEDFASYAGPETLAIVDIEGAEMELLDPVRYPALKEIDLIVEMHECIQPGSGRTLLERFMPSHGIELIHNRSIHFPLEQIFGPQQYFDHFDNMVVTFEGRAGPTPWAFMKRKPK